MFLVPNSVCFLILDTGLVLARLGLLDRKYAVRIAGLSWPRVVTGLARMLKDIVDTAVMSIASGTITITGVGLAGLYWGLTFTLGGGIADGTIVLVSQWLGVDATGELGLVARSSTFLTIIATLPVTTVF